MYTLRRLFKKNKKKITKVLELFSKLVWSRFIKLEIVFDKYSLENVF